MRRQVRPLIFMALAALTPVLATARTARAQGFYSTMPIQFGGYGGYNWYTYGNYGGINPYQAFPGLYNRNYYFQSPLYYSPIMSTSFTDYTSPTGGMQIADPVVIVGAKPKGIRRIGRALTPGKRVKTVIIRGQY